MAADGVHSRCLLSQQDSPGAIERQRRQREKGAGSNSTEARTAWSRSLVETAMTIELTIEPLSSRQTWMQARIRLAGTTALSLAHGVHRADLATGIAPLSRSVSSSYQTTEVTPVTGIVERGSAYIPKTELGRRLVAIRGKAIRSGMKLLTADEIRAELARRRGEMSGC
jgi:hypothetical protein